MNTKYNSNNILTNLNKTATHWAIVIKINSREVFSLRLKILFSLTRRDDQRIKYFTNLFPLAFIAPLTIMPSNSVYEIIHLHPSKSILLHILMSMNF